MPAAPLRLSRLALGLAALLALAGGAGTQAALPSMLDAPIVDFRLTLFEDETGRKTSDLRGATALYLGSEQVEVREFILTLLNRKADTVLAVRSPKAIVNTKTRIVEGDNTIEVAGPGYALDGKRWLCDEPARKIAIRDGAHVVFEAPLIDILK